MNSISERRLLGIDEGHYKSRWCSYCWSVNAIHSPVIYLPVIVVADDDDDELMMNVMRFLLLF